MVQDNSQTSVTTTILDSNGQETWYSKDTTHVYFAGNLVQGADPATFYVFPNSLKKTQEVLGLAKDKNHVYLDADTVHDADANSFMLVSAYADLNSYNSSYAKDKNHVYMIGGDPTVTISIIPGADPATFQIVSSQSTYDAEDKNHKYLQGQIVQDNSQTSATTSPGLDVQAPPNPAWSVILDINNKPSDYYRDGSVVYYAGDYGSPTEVAGADANSFVPFPQIVDSTGASNSYYAKDATNIYCRNAPLQGADYATFEVDSIFTAHDKNHQYATCGIYDSNNP